MARIPLVIGLGAIVGVACLLAWQSNSPPRAVAGPVILVDTAQDTFGDNQCSIHEAISAANLGALVDSCQGNLSNTIGFNLQPPLIMITAALPNVTAPVMIQGNNGGTRVELRGNGLLNGLNVDATADGTSIQDLVLTNFEMAISVAADDVVIQGNYIGTNVAGTAALANSYGVFVEGGSRTKIGGSSGVTPGGGCTGDCNLISGNNYGMYISSGADNVVQGNFIGTNATGEGAIPNNQGIHNQATGTLIGGPSSGQGNLISGNVGTGTDTFSHPSTIQGNLIGTDTDGEAAIPNSSGIILRDHAGTVVGGQGTARNVISGNSNDGIFIGFSSSGIQVIGNLIGTAANGQGALGNGGNGITIIGQLNIIGFGDPADGNTIAFNAGDGVRVDGVTAVDNAIQANSIHDNGGKGIENINGGNDEFAPPIILAVGSASGTACPDCEVDIYSDNGDEGKIWEGKVGADAQGNWSFPGAVTGPNITATATDPINNTSEFSQTAVAPTPTPSPSPSPSPTPTSTVSPAPTPSATPATELIQGDIDCDGDADPVDALKLTLGTLDLDYDKADGCPEVGGPIPAVGSAGVAFGNVDCMNAVTLDDVLAILRDVAGFTYPRGDGCPAIGEPI